MMELAYREPGIMWVAVPAVLAVIGWQWRRRRTFVGFSSADWILRLGRGPSRVRRLPTAAAFAALGLILVALLDPVVPYAEGQVSARGSTSSSSSTCHRACRRSWGWSARRNQWRN